MLDETVTFSYISGIATYEDTLFIYGTSTNGTSNALYSYVNDAYTLLSSTSLEDVKGPNIVTDTTGDVGGVQFAATSPTPGDGTYEFIIFTESSGWTARK